MLKVKFNILLQMIFYIINNKQAIYNLNYSQFRKSYYILNKFNDLLILVYYKYNY